MLTTPIQIESHVEQQDRNSGQTGFAVFLELGDSSLKSEEDVARLLSLPVLALVPRMPSERERKALRRRMILVNVGGTFVLLVSAAVLLRWAL